MSATAITSRPILNNWGTSVRQTFQDPNWDKAGALLQEHGISSEDHVLLQENLATYLENGAAADPQSRFGFKLKRDLETPYTDEQVLNHTNELQNSLLQNLAAIPVTPSHVYINGSFARGRLGNNSDLDAMIALRGEDRQANLKPLQQLASDTGATVFPMFLDDPYYNRAVFVMNGSSRRVDLEDLNTPGFLRSKYADELGHRGIAVDTEGHCHKVGPSKPRRETNRYFEKLMAVAWKEDKTVEQKWEALYSDSWKSKTIRTGFRLAGLMCSLPLVGPIVTHVADFFLAQDHQPQP